MDDRRFDRLTRALTTAGSRRQTLLGALAIGATAFAGARRSEAQAPTPAAGGAVAGAGTTLCAGDGQPCVMLTGCCSGFTCVTSAINPNQGFCQSGGSGGVVIAPPAMAGDTSGSAQPAPTSTPRPRKTHTPGDNKNTTSNTNTSNRPAYALHVTLDCIDSPETTTIRNVGSQVVTLSRFVVPDNPAYTDAKPFTPSAGKKLKPGRKVTFFSNTNLPAAQLPHGFLWSNDKVYLNGNADLGVKVYIDQTTTPFPGGCGGTRTGTGSGRKHRKHKRKSK